jgi:hypothetical protein
VKTLLDGSRGVTPEQAQGVIDLAGDQLLDETRGR